MKDLIRYIAICKPLHHNRAKPVSEVNESDPDVLTPLMYRINSLEEEKAIVWKVERGEYFGGFSW